MPVDENYKRSQSGNIARRTILDRAVDRSIKRGDVIPCGVPRKMRRRILRQMKKDKGNTIKEIE